MLESEAENWYARRGHEYFLYEYEMSRMGAGEQIPEFVYFTRKAMNSGPLSTFFPRIPLRMRHAGGNGSPQNSTWPSATR